MKVMTSKSQHSDTKMQAVKKLLNTKIVLKTRVQKGEKLTTVAKELGVKVVQPL